MDRRSALKRTGILMGSGIVLSTSGLLFQACMEKVEKKQFQTRILNQGQANAIVAISDILIADPQLPENVRLSIPLYMDAMLKDYVGSEQKKAFINGFNDFTTAFFRKHDKNFVESSKEEKLDFLKELENEFVQAETSTFYGFAKQWIFEGFFQSEYGITNYLEYNPVPETYLGCVNFDDVGKIAHSNDSFKL
ncbi:MAG: hypothetical protein Mars2KO_42510 [Maribacter sp.]